MNNTVKINGKVHSTGAITGVVAISSTEGRPESYHGEYEVTPKTNTSVTLETKGLLMADDVVISKVPYYETSNIQNGYTVYIGNEV